MSIGEIIGKYVVKNCPNITFIDLWRLDPKWSYCKLKKCGCENITDCLLKKIYKTCKQEIKVNNADAPTNAYAMGRMVVAEKILDLLDIQECE